MNPETQSETFILQKKLELAEDALKDISKWRVEAHEYDDDMGHELRDFGEEDIELIEEFAHNILEKMKEL